MFFVYSKLEDSAVIGLERISIIAMVYRKAEYSTTSMYALHELTWYSTVQSFLRF